MTQDTIIKIDPADDLVDADEVPKTFEELGASPEVCAALKARGVLASAMDARTLRLVTHRDVSHSDCQRAAEALAEALA